MLRALQKYWQFSKFYYKWTWKGNETAETSFCAIVSNNFSSKQSVMSTYYQTFRSYLLFCKLYQAYTKRYGWGQHITKWQFYVISANLLLSLIWFFNLSNVKSPKKTERCDIFQQFLFYNPIIQTHMFLYGRNCRRLFCIIVVNYLQTCLYSCCQ
jgi:hypothetical protein